MNSIELKVGQIIAEDVYTSNGQLLARKGARVSEGMLPRLKKLLSGQSIRVLLSKEQEADTEQPDSPVQE
jgi:hypothetical protein